MKKIKISALNAKDVNGQTPLHLACYAGDFKVVKLLVKHGADKSARDRKNLRPLDLCSNKMVMKHLSSLPEVVSQKDEAGMKDFVNSGFDLNFSNNSYLMTSLHYAVMNGGLVNKVIALTGDVNQCDWNNYTPLHLACIQGKLEDAKILIENQANVMAKSSSGLTPLHLACKFDRVSLVQPLIESGADKDAVDNHSRTPLMIAAKHGSVKCVKELLAEKCNFRKTDERLWNALHYASFHCKNLVVKVLVKWNADDHELLGMRNSQGMTPQELTTDVKTRKAFQSKT
jgi:ankyrin repeat protein